MLDAISAVVSVFSFKKKNVWVCALVEDNRTMLVGNGYTEEGAVKNSQSETDRMCIVSKDGLHKAYLPPSVKEPHEVPEGILETINNHLGFSPMENSSKAEQS
jgi:hypothetical protein